ncbi:ABC-2 type transport system permease protein [Asanoa hainanensis]|uniref:ABC-2 type transport system permease protein n=1 Tax=Asanoa hainanensis TaxID=560556 RepID=A0A239PES3_9ACTN|nr:ABC transporter permease [Asanoa hainanensis]SNT65512.1 ABC-2 type transport system permease protein [Asanoa hainanensis]
MNGLPAALTAEAVKSVAARVVRAASLFIVVGISVLATTLTWAANRGNEQVLAQLGPAADLAGWDRLLGVAAQVTAAGALLGFGVVLSWAIGREFADGTIAGLYGLPVSRASIALAKLVVHLCWTVLVGVLLTAALLLVGLLLGLGPLDSAAASGLARQFVLTVLSGGLALPAAWAATLGRGLLAGVAATIAIIVVAQVAVVAGSGAWLPLAAPALWAIRPDSVSGAQVALALTVPALFTLATVRAWRRLELDR